MTEAHEERDAPPGRGRILVAVGSSPNSAHLLHWARRNAEALHAAWWAVHVDSGRTLSKPDEERLEANLALARRLGAETMVIRCPDVAKGVVEAAHNHGATMIVIGRSGLSRLGPFPKRATVSDRIVREAGAVDVAVIQDAFGPRRDITFAYLRQLFAAPLRQYLLLALVFILVSGLGLLVEPAVGYRNVALVFLSVVLGLSFVAKPAPVALFAILSALSLDFFFISPQFTLSISALDDLFLFAAYFVVAFATGLLVARLRTEGRRLAEREKMGAFLLSSTQRLAGATALDEALGEAVAIIREHFATETLVHVPLEEGNLAPWPGNRSVIGAEELAMAQRAFEEGRAFGPDGAAGEPGPYRHFPAMSGGKAVAVLSVTRPEERGWTRDDDNLMFALGRTLALIVDRERSEARSRKAAMEHESDRLAKLLLDSVSHELRTPLTTITGTLSALRDESLATNPDSRRLLVEGALDASDRLNRLVEDILSASRMEARGFSLSLSFVDVSDIANESLDAAKPDLDEGRVMLELPPTGLIARVDASLVSRLAANLLRNAARYSPSGSPIGLVFEAHGRDLAITVRDHGPGVPEAELPAIFDRFSRGHKAKGGGLGLGLSICRGIAAAHGGSIGARNLPGGGFEVKALFPSCIEEVEP